MNLVAAVLISLVLLQTSLCVSKVHTNIEDETENRINARVKEMLLTGDNDPFAPLLDPPASSVTPAAGGDASAAPSAASPASAAKPKGIPTLPEDMSFEPKHSKLLVGVSQELLRSLPRLLGQTDLSELACKRAARCIRLVVYCASHHKQIMFEELEMELHK